MTVERKFIILRHDLISAIRKMRDEGEPGKSYEGIFEISYCFPEAGYTGETISDHPESVTISLHCYLIGPARHYSWNGNTFEKALQKCEKDVRKWLADCNTFMEG